MLPWRTWSLEGRRCLHQSVTASEQMLVSILYMNQWMCDSIWLNILFSSNIYIFNEYNSKFESVNHPYLICMLRLIIYYSFQANLLLQIVLSGAGGSDLIKILDDVYMSPCIISPNQIKQHAEQLTNAQNNKWATFTN